MRSILFRSMLSFPAKISSLAIFTFFLSSSTVFASNQLPSSIIINTENYSETIPAETIISWLDLKTTLSIDISKKSEIENTEYCPTIPSFCGFSVPRALRTHTIIGLRSTPNDKAIGAFVTELAERIDREPENAVFSADDSGSIIIAQPEKVGRKLKEIESVDLLSRAIRSGITGPIKIDLPIETAKPSIIADDRERLGLRELIGTGKTNFKGSTKNRIYNIKRALEQFQGALIVPNETFSFVTQLGEVDGEHGYLPELVIKDNKTQPEFGGGICQVSSTVFRTAINTGLKIVERRNHAYPVHYYYPYGMDATVYVPKPDLRFINNTPGYILMQSTIEGTELTFRFFGTKDDRNVKVDGPHILDHQPDGSMKTVFSQLVTDNSGNTIINDSFWSNYKSPSLFPHPGQESVITEKPKDWSSREWKAYKAIHP